MVRRLFEAEIYCEIAGEAENGRDAITKAAKIRPDLIILDLNMPVMGGLEAAPLLRKASPQSQLILFTIHQGPEVEQLALAAGIQMVVCKDKAVSELIPRARILLSTTDS
jgi:DNA-binding NarL/FixJ family response regulator